MAPEILDDKTSGQYSYASDVFSLAVVINTVLAFEVSVPSARTTRSARERASARAVSPPPLHLLPALSRARSSRTKARLGSPSGARFRAACGPR